jgi:hypothetical protein
MLFDVAEHRLPRSPAQPASRPSAATAQLPGDQQEYQRVAGGVDDQGTAAGTRRDAELRGSLPGISPSNDLTRKLSTEMPIVTSSWPDVPPG